MAGGDGLKNQEIINLFKKKNFRATPQRIAVFDYVFEHRTHPDASEIYNEVKRQYPAFSKTTVYNALGALAKNGFIMPVMIDSDCVHYDADTSVHGHFYCERCKRIYDFGTELPVKKELDGFTVMQKAVYYRGICPCCKNT